MLGQVITVEKKKFIYVYSPYSSSNNAHFKAFKGHWDNERSIWRLAKSTEIKKMLSDLFGEESPDVRVRFFEDRVEKSPLAWQIGGYVIWTRKQPNSAPIYPDRVLLRQVWPQSVIELNVRQNFALRENLEIIATDDPAFAAARLARLREEELAKLAARKR